MQEQILDFFQQYPNIAFFTSILISVLIALLGVVPSIFITGANILFFGFWEGTAISFLGEVFGALISFWLYRRGFNKTLQSKLKKFPKVHELIASEGNQAFVLIILLRLLPFVPSGVVTFAAAIGKVRPVTFISASALGKVPALLIEAYTAYQLISFGWESKVIAITIVLILFYYVFKKIRDQSQKIN